jgi:selenocysteine lyase/cysteine desulfurase
MNAAAALGAFRAQFPALARVAWLSTAGVAPGARDVLDAVARAQEEWGNGTFDWHAWEGDADAARGRFATRVGAPAASIALVSTLADAAATVAHAVDAGTARRRPRVIVPATEFRSNLFPWLALREVGFEVVPIPADADGLVRTDAILAATMPGVVLVAVSDVQSATGHRIDARAIADRCRTVGARSFFNLTQSLGALRFNVEDVGADFVAAHSYKWLLAPRGATFLYIHPDRWAEMAPLAPNWKNVEDPHAEVYGEPYALAVDARRVDASLGWFAWIGARAALELLDSVDSGMVESHALRLAGLFRSGAHELGYDVVPTECPSQLASVAFADAESAATIERGLRERGVITSARGRRVRFGFHGFNDESDLGLALDGLKRLRSTSTGH